MSRKRWLQLLSIMLVINIPGIVILTRSMHGVTALVPATATVIFFGLAIWMVMWLKRPS